MRWAQKILRKASRFLRILRTQLHFRLGRVRFGARPLSEGFLPAIQNDGRISIGNHFWSIGDTSRPTMRVARGARLDIGDRLLLNAGATLEVASRVTIGHDVRIAGNVYITDTNGHEVESGEGVTISAVVVEDDVWIGRAAIILPGVTVGRGAVIAAGSVVTHDVSPDTVVAGVPASVIRHLAHRGKRS